MHMPGLLDKRVLDGAPLDRSVSEDGLPDSGMLNGKIADRTTVNWTMLDNEAVHRRCLTKRPPGQGRWT